MNSLDDLPFSEQDGTGLRYSTLISGEINRDGKKRPLTKCDFT